ncbi:hypothetical protein [Rubrolithibacter danxiaensis]|uniref:hypothetical protein n=1 Tax=Rubrolithibacter danxiaensis TaxID=3390805 RepID=UPI003BF7E845
MKLHEEEFPEENEDLSLTGPNELNEEDLEPEEDIVNSENIENNSDSTNDNDKMEDPENDLDEDEVKRLFPGMTEQNSDMEDLNDSV